MSQEIVLSDVGLNSVEELFEEFQRTVAENIHELRGPDEKLEPTLPDPKAANLEEQMRTSLFSSLTQSEKDLGLFGAPVADADRLKVLIHKVKELDNHAQGGPYADMLQMLHQGLNAIAESVQPQSDTEKQCGVFGQSYLLKPLVHYLSRWDVKKRKEAEEKVEWALRNRDESHNNSIEFARNKKIAEARDAEAKSLTYGTEAIAANKVQRSELDRLQSEANAIDLVRYSDNAKEFVSKWRQAYNESLQLCTFDADNLSAKQRAAEEKREEIHNEFVSALKDHNARVADNNRRREDNLRKLRELLADEVRREVELKNEQRSILKINESLRLWKDQVAKSEDAVARRQLALADALDTISSGLRAIDNMENLEDDLALTLTNQMEERKQALLQERERLLVEHYDVTKEQLKMYTRKGDRMRRRIEKLEQLRKECFFTLEMAYEGDVSPEDYNEAPQQATRYAAAITEMTQKFQDLRQDVALVDDDDFKRTLQELQLEHPVRQITEELQHERGAYGQKIQARLREEETALCNNQVLYLSSPRMLDEVPMHERHLSTVSPVVLSPSKGPRR